MIAIDVLRWPGVNQAFLVSFVAALVLSFAIIPYGKRRPVDAPFDWGQAVLGSTYIFGVMFLAFGVVPPMDQPRRQEPRLVARQAARRFGAVSEAGVARRLEPGHPPVRGGS